MCVCDVFSVSSVSCDLFSRKRRSLRLRVVSESLPVGPLVSPERERDRQTDRGREIQSIGGFVGDMRVRGSLIIPVLSLQECRLSSSESPGRT